jgi:hypothetical protein
MLSSSYLGRGEAIPGPFMAGGGRMDGAAVYPRTLAKVNVGQAPVSAQLASKPAGERPFAAWRASVTHRWGYRNYATDTRAATTGCRFMRSVVRTAPS